MIKIVCLSILMLSFINCKEETKSKGEILEKGKIEKIDSLANRYLELNRFSGVILVIKDNTLIYNNSFGFANYDTKKPFSNKTTFKIGEISELVTANIIRSMAKNNKLDLGAKISKYLPEIKSGFTINELLNHKTNLPSLYTIKEQHPELDYSTIDYVNLAIQSPDKSERSALNYNILGVLIEKISAKTFQENVETYSKLLSLKNTYYKKTDSLLASGYLYHNYQGNGLELQNAPISNLDVTFSSNGIKSSANDLIKIISVNSTDELEINGYLENDGFSYALVNNPNTKIAHVVLSNRRHPVAIEISNSIDAILVNTEYTLPLARKQIEINSKLLKDYSGFYALNANTNLEVINKNDSLFVMMGPNKIHLVPQSSNQFYMEQMDASMRFLRDTDNKVKEVELLDGFLKGNRIKRKSI